MLYRKCRTPTHSPELWVSWTFYPLKTLGVLDFGALTFPDFPCMDPCMATKTISLELDAYERLKQAKRGNESFSSVVRRARFEPEPCSGEAILKETAARYGAGHGVPARTFDYWEEAAKSSPGVSRSHWESV